MKINSLKKYGLYTILSIILIILDQYTKHLANKYLMNKKPFVIVKGVFEFNYLDGGNTGATWGIFSGNIIFLIILPALVCILLLILIIRTQKLINFAITNNINVSRISKLYTILQLTIVLLISGAIGNFIDRITKHYVIDFLYFKLIDFPIFNVADCYVTVSMFVLIILLCFFIKEEELNYIIQNKADMFFQQKKEQQNTNNK